MKESRLRNGVLKTKERARRYARMTDALKTGKMPYGRVVLSWLSTKLDKPARLITQADVDKFLQPSKHALAGGTPT
jgi:hypothetical protein